MNTKIITSVLNEFGRLVLRSENSSQDLSSGALKFLKSNPGIFKDANILEEHLQKEDKFEKLYIKLFDKEKNNQEPCNLPFFPRNAKSRKGNIGFLLNFFKGEQDIGPVPIEKISLGSKQYQSFLNLIKRELEQINEIVSIEKWLSLLKRYTQWLPTNKKLNNTSLYNYCHLKMALAALLTEEEIDKILADLEKNVEIEEEPLALFAVKIAGKDKIFFSDDTQNNFNILKGACYYIQMLRENIANEYLKKIDLPVSNLLFAEDDWFCLLVRKDHSEKLIEQQIKLEEFLLKHYNAKLSLANVFLPFKLNVISGQNPQNKLDQLLKQLNHNIKQPFNLLLSNNSGNYSKIFGPYKTDDEMVEKEKQFYKSLDSLGKKLTDAKWVALKESKNVSEKKQKHWEEMPLHFGNSTDFLDKRTKKQNYENIYSFNNTNFLKSKGNGAKFSQVVPYLKVNKVPKYEEYYSVINITIMPKTISYNSLTDFLTTKNYLDSFFKTKFHTLLKDSRFLKYTYFIDISTEFINIICSPKITLSLLLKIYKNFHYFTNNNFILNGRIGLFQSQYPFNQALCYELQNFYYRTEHYNKITILEERVPWFFLTSILKAQSRLAKVSKCKLFPMLAITELFLKRKKDKKNMQEWSFIINYHFERLGLKHVKKNLERHLLEGELGPAYLNLSIQWNHFMSL